MTAKRSTPSSDRWITVGIAVVPVVVSGIIGLITLGSWLGSLQTGIKAQFTELLIQVDGKIAPVSNKVDSVSAKVDNAQALVQQRVDAVSTKVDNAQTLVQQKVDALSDSFKNNQTEQQTFRASVQTGFTKLFDKQTDLGNQIQQEKVDRLTDSKKK